MQYTSVSGGLATSACNKLNTMGQLYDVLCSLQNCYIELNDNKCWINNFKFFCGVELGDSSTYKRRKNGRNIISWNPSARIQTMNVPGEWDKITAERGTQEPDPCRRDYILMQYITENGGFNYEISEYCFKHAELNTKDNQLTIFCKGNTAIKRKISLKPFRLTPISLGQVPIMSLNDFLDVIQDKSIALLSKEHDSIISAMPNYGNTRLDLEIRQPGGAVGRYIWRSDTHKQKQEYECYFHSVEHVSGSTYKLIYYKYYEEIRPGVFNKRKYTLLFDLCKVEPVFS